MSADSAAVFERGICAEEKTLSRRNCVRMTDAEEDRICRECFQGAVIDGFREAINQPSQYPYRWGQDDLYFQDFRSRRHIPDDVWKELTVAYEARREELEMPLEARLYCRLCGVFVGQMTAGEARDTTCPGCSQQICENCGQSGIPHSCDDEPEDENLNGLERGKDYQRCPGCRARTELADGCNHIFCIQCRTNFCYICGKEAHPDSGHWNAGKPCPRWNQPGEANAQHDGEEDEDEEDEGNEGEESGDERSAGERDADEGEGDEEMEDEDSNDDEPTEEERADILAKLAAYVPDQRDVDLQEHVEMTRSNLRTLRAELEHQLDDPSASVITASDEPRSHLLRRLLVTVDNIIFEIGILDYRERLDPDLYKGLQARWDQVIASWEDPRDREAMRRLPVLGNAIKDYLAHEVNPFEGRGFINIDEWRTL